MHLRVPFCLLEDLSNIIMALSLGLGRQDHSHEFCVWCRKSQKIETALGLNQAASQALQPGPAAADCGGGTDAAGPPAADGGGGGGTDAQVIELTRKTSAMEA